jgi:hypothetical protein
VKISSSVQTAQKNHFFVASEIFNSFAISRNFPQDYYFLITKNKEIKSPQPQLAVP